MKVIRDFFMRVLLLLTAIMTIKATVLYPMKNNKNNAGSSKKRKVTKKKKSYLQKLASEKPRVIITPRKAEIEDYKRGIKLEKQKHEHFQNRLGLNTFAKIIAVSEKHKDYDFVSIFLTKYKKSKETVEQLKERLEMTYDIDFCKESKKDRLLEVFKNMHLIRLYLLRCEKVPVEMMSVNSVGAKMVEEKLLPVWIKKYKEASSRKKLLQAVTKLRITLDTDYEVLQEKEKIFNTWKRLRIISAKIDEVVEKAKASTEQELVKKDACLEV